MYTIYCPNAKEEHEAFLFSVILGLKLNYKVLVRWQVEWELAQIHKPDSADEKWGRESWLAVIDMNSG